LICHQGLLAGDALHLDLKRMEMAYLDNKKRELEITRNISLRQLDPVQLLALRSTGTCTFNVPEWLYDRDCPGHYMRRIKSGANLALLYSLPNDFPTEWSAFLNSAADLSVTLKRDYFPYFSTGRAITIGLRLYGAKPTATHLFGDPGQATTDLATNKQFTVTAPPHPVGPTQVLVRTAGTKAFLVVQYTVG
jgi:hypothetical protein